MLAQSCQDDDFPSINIKKQSPVKWNQKEQCSIIYTFEDDEVEMPAKIKYRGGLSSRYEKKSFSIELEKKYAFVNLPKDDDWILTSNYIDKTFMRHKINYDLYQEMNEEHISAESGYVNVMVNDTFCGLYLITEEINGKKVKLDKDDPQAMLFKDPPIFYTDPLVHPQDKDNYYQQKFPKKNKVDHTPYIESFRSFLFDASDEEFDARIGDWIDLGNVIDWHLLLLYSYNGDGVMKNFYLYKRDSYTPFQIAIWDSDHSFGRDGDGELNMMDRPFKWKRSILFNRLMNSEGFNYRARLADRWTQLRTSGIFSYKNMQRKINTIDAVISSQVSKNFEKWPVDSKWYYDDKDYKAEKAIILEFVKLRLEVLDEEFGYK